MNFLGAVFVVGLTFCFASHAATVSVFAGGGAKETGAATECRLADPFACEFDAQGNAFICEMTNNRVVKVDARGHLTLFAGTTKKGASGDGGPATRAELNGPHNLTVMRNGDVLIADSWNWKVRRVDARTGIMMPVAGTGVRGFSGDGGTLASEAQFSGIYSLAFNASEKELFLADLENRRVRAIDLTSMKVRTVAGNGTKAVPSEDSMSTNAPLFDPRAVAVTKSGEVYILERGGHALRVVSRDGKIRTVVGTGKPGPWTPTENPREATLKGSKHLCLDRDENVLIADSENCVIRKYFPRENRITLVAGTGKQGRAFNADPLKVELNHPHGVSVDGQGNIYVADSYNGRVLKISP